MSDLSHPARSVGSLDARAKSASGIAPASQGPGDRLDALQALRALAAGAVVLHHALRTYHNRVDPTFNFEFVASLGDLGVKLFFCISGLIICNTSADLPAGPDSGWYFIRRRLVRIVPMYWMATFIYYLKLLAEGASPGLGSLVMSLLFLPYPGPLGVMQPVLGLGWTLNFEMFFYGVFAFALLAQGAVRYGLVFGLLGLLMLARALGWLTPQGGYPSLALYLLSAPYLLYFLAGVALALLHRRSHRLLRTPMRFETVLLTISLLLAAFVGATQGRWLPAQHFEAVELPLCAICVGLCLLPRPVGQGHASRLQRALVAAGDGSYSTYLTHGFLLGPAGRLLGLVGGTAMPPVVFALALTIACTGVGVVLYRLIEKPLIKRLNPKRPARLARERISGSATPVPSAVAPAASRYTQR